MQKKLSVWNLSCFCSRKKESKWKAQANPGVTQTVNTFFCHGHRYETMITWQILVFKHNEWLFQRHTGFSVPSGPTWMTDCFSAAVRLVLKWKKKTEPHSPALMPLMWNPLWSLPSFLIIKKSLFLFQLSRCLKEAFTPAETFHIFSIYIKCQNSVYSIRDVFYWATQSKVKFWCTNDTFFSNKNLGSVHLCQSISRSIIP